MQESGFGHQETPGPWMDLQLPEAGTFSELALVRELA